MVIFVLTPIYATTTSKQGMTPVIHYFTREWAKMGHDVTVFNLVANYPKPFYWIGKLFQHRLNSWLGMLVPTESPKDCDYKAEGVTVHCRCFKKFRPHAPYSKNELQRALNYIISECERSGVPDWFVGHWDNPQLELLTALKKRFGKPICLVFHSNRFDLKRKYGEAGVRMVKNLDVVGFRSNVGQENFIKQYGELAHSFIASSGVSEFFLKAGAQSMRVVKQPIRNFVFVGSLINRKYPLAVLQALMKVYPAGGFKMTFIGDGAEKATIENEYSRMGKKGELVFTGRIPRERIAEHLAKSDVFIMVSSGEIFGLVYLEAMSFGLITVGSKNEGIDGIIHDGDNGFLCEAGNVNELSEVLKKINTMPSEQLVIISKNARATAFEYSDEGVARRYLKALSQQ